MSYKKYLLEIVVWSLIVAIVISLVYYNITGKNEHFSQISTTDIQQRNTDRTKLQILINKYESKSKCCEGYHQPINTCKFSFNTSEAPMCNR
jgi:hypothetical protein